MRKSLSSLSFNRVAKISEPESHASHEKKWSLWNQLWMHEKCFLCSSEVLLMECCLELRSTDRLSLIICSWVKRSSYITGSLLTRVKHLPYALLVKCCLLMLRLRNFFYGLGLSAFWVSFRLFLFLLLDFALKRSSGRDACATVERI